MTWTRQAVRHYDGRIVPGQDPTRRRNFWFTVAPIPLDAPPTEEPTETIVEDESS